MADTIRQTSDTSKQARRAPHSCGGCDHRWTGASYAHCARCHRTFSSVANFDRHRSRKQEVVGGKGGKKVILREFGQCYDPADDGMVFTDRGVWSMPSDGMDFTAVFGGDE